MKAFNRILSVLIISILLCCISCSSNSNQSHSSNNYNSLSSNNVTISSSSQISSSIYIELTFKTFFVLENNNVYGIVSPETSYFDFNKEIIAPEGYDYAVCFYEDGSYSVLSRIIDFGPGETVVYIYLLKENTPIKYYTVTIYRPDSQSAIQSKSLSISASLSYLQNQKNSIINSIIHDSAFDSYMVDNEFPEFDFN